jgi:UDP-N-acetylmuramate: L-alanyl-gamma-D-glutamyl-meso-diaminopimelate ligase
MELYDYYYLAKRNLLPDADKRTRIKVVIKKNSSIHVSAVCGKAMASIACMLKDLGYKVTGSDVAFHPPMGDVLKKHNIKCTEYSAKNIKNIDVLVVGNALAHDSLEVEEARKRDIPMLSGPEVLGQVFKNRKSLVVAGTHGKTTTSALLTHVFESTKKSPGYMIGGVFQNSKDSYSIGSIKSKYVIYEGDEYNSAFFDRGPKFLHYNPTSVILTSIEYDHVDLYPSFEDYKQAFQFLIEMLPKKGNLVVHESVLQLLDFKKCKAKVVVYGTSKKADVVYKVKQTNSSGILFSVTSKIIGNYQSVTIPLFGEYNIANATAVFVLALLEGLKSEIVISALQNFPGTKERQELIGIKKDKNIVVIRDYAHHPTAVKLTLEGLKCAYPQQRFVVAFEPRSASSKRKVFEFDYAESLSQGDVIYTIDPVSSPTPDSIDVANIVKILKAKGKKAFTASSAEEVLLALKKEVQKNDVIVCMSSGDMSAIPQRFLQS